MSPPSSGPASGSGTGATTSAATAPRQHRNNTFRPERTPFRHIDSLQPCNSSIAGPFVFLNPTRAHFDHTPLAKDAGAASSASSKDRDADDRPPSSQEGDAPVDGDGKQSQKSTDEKAHPHRHPKRENTQTATDYQYKWTSRNNRKGRHAIVVQPASAGTTGTYKVPRKSTDPREILHIIWLMCTYFPVWDVSYDVATIFTLGSVIWVINAFFSFLPFTNPSTEFPTEVLYGGGITAFIGATVFEIGSFLLMAEAVNEHRSGCFGWAVEQLFTHDKGDGSSGPQYALRPAKSHCEHHHVNRHNFVGKSTSSATSSSVADPDGKNSATPGKTWVWFPSWYELRTHYLHDIGFLACLSQLFGASVFWISGFTALPGINNILSPAALKGAYWVPQVIGGSGFIVSGTLFLLETQKNWYTPALTTLGWHIGLWNLIGGFGFTLCPAFGFDTAHWAQYQASCSTFWGSWAFLVGSTIQWYESLQKYPVEVAKE